jgi:hypothetical protein
MNLPDPTLAGNEFYFILSRSGDFIKTRFKEDFEEISSWKNIIFYGVIKNNCWLHYLVGQIWFKKHFSSMPVAESFKLNNFYDLELIETPHCSFISKTKIGGKEKPESYQEL